jgi:hypothetical protein
MTTRDNRDVAGSKRERDGEGGEKVDNQGENRIEKKGDSQGCRQLTVSVRTLNSTLSCPLCLGYYRDAYAIAECLHTCTCLLLPSMLNQLHPMFHFSLLFFFCSTSNQFAKSIISQFAKSVFCGTFRLQL